MPKQPDLSPQLPTGDPVAVLERRYRTRSRDRPRASAQSSTMALSAPCPFSWMPVSSSTEPSGWTAISAEQASTPSAPRLMPRALRARPMP